MKRFLCFALVMLMCLGGQALATPQWQNAEPVKAEDLPEGVREGLLEMNPNANTLTLLVWQPLEEQQTQHVPEPQQGLCNHNDHRHPGAGSPGLL